MINSNGNLISSFNEIPEEFIEQLHTQLSVLEVLRFEDGNILFWELHYFRILASLRRHRFEIPMNYTMEYLEAEVIRLSNATSSSKTIKALIKIQFLPYQKSIVFIMSLRELDSFNKIKSSKNYRLDLFKEDYIRATNLSNLSNTNGTLYYIASRYAKENGFDDCVILNDQKNLVETLKGSLYLLQGDKILTSTLKCGCQDFALRSAFNEWVEKKQKVFRLIEQEINPFELQKSEELMVISIEYGGQSISQYRKTTYNTYQLKELFSRFIQ